MKKQQLLDNCFQALLEEKKTVCIFTGLTDLVKLFEVLRKTDYDEPVWSNEWCAILSKPKVNGVFLVMSAVGVSLFFRVQDDTGRIKLTYIVQ